VTRSSRKEEQQLLEKIYAKAQRRRAAKKAGVPQVGIVFVYKGKVFIDGTPVTEAESLGGQFKIHDRDHYKYWEQLRGMGAVPADVEYDEVPRGRVVYDTKSRKYTLFLDRCILRNKKLVSRIRAHMSLFENTATDTDSHYRCPACLRRAG
jgi:hypothetical protein